MLSRDETFRWLLERDPENLELLWRQADGTRKDHVGDAIHLRGLVEISNQCVRRCAYCGINATNAALERYRMSADEIAACARRAAALGYGTVVLQGGEDYGLSCAWVGDLVRRIKHETGLAVTLSLGERSDGDLAAWRHAGADRYLLRFETSDAELYRRIHPDLPGRGSDRIAVLRRMRELGYEIGSGVMIGIPGQSWASLADDILTFAALDLDMIGVGPFIPHPATPLGAGAGPSLPAGEQVPADELTTCKVIALARLACPEANIPATTALATLAGAEGRELGLARGANVVMPNLTPSRYRAGYAIYPGKACLSESVGDDRLRAWIAGLGRTPGTGPGGRARLAPTPVGAGPRGGSG